MPRKFLNSVFGATLLRDAEDTLTAAELTDADEADDDCSELATDEDVEDVDDEVDVELQTTDDAAEPAQLFTVTFRSGHETVTHPLASFMNLHWVVPSVVTEEGKDGAHEAIFTVSSSCRLRRPSFFPLSPVFASVSVTSFSMRWYCSQLSAAEETAPVQCLWYCSSRRLRSGL